MPLRTMLALLATGAAASAPGKTFTISVAGREMELRRPSASACPCADTKLCQPITTGPRKEVYGFKPSGATDWDQFDWSTLTTVAWVQSADLMCTAHSHGARAVLSAGGWSIQNISDPAYRSKWVQSHVQLALDNYLDGTNFDYESPIGTFDEARGDYTALVKETKEAFSKAIQGSQVTVDVAWSPDGIDGRFYDWVGLANASDFLFVMSYDTRSQIFGRCVAAANSAPALDRHGLESFLSLGISPEKLVLGLPWYGYRYPCQNNASKTVDYCELKRVPFRGVNCSDAAGSEINYSSIMQILNSSAPTTGRRWDETLQSPFFDFVGDDGRLYQMWYDDPQSLSIKFKMATQMGLRGVGFWNLDALDYSGDAKGAADTRAMWNAVARYYGHGTNTTHPLRV